MIICGPAWDLRAVDIAPRKNVGIIMSGGIDSWVMYNLLTDYVKPTIFNIARADGFDNVNRVSLITNRPVITIKERSTQHWERLPLTIDHILKTYDLDELYYGINAVPPVNHFPEFATFDEPTRPWRVVDNRVKTPFLHLFKYHILDIANQRNIDLSWTMSCIRSTIEPCNECWQCREKAWGFSQLIEK